MSKGLGGLWPTTMDEPTRYAPEANTYLGHRMTFAKGKGFACDCGRPFPCLIDLERHQHGYRHPLFGSW